MPGYTIIFRYGNEEKVQPSDEKKKALHALLQVGKKCTGKTCKQKRLIWTGAEDMSLSPTEQAPSALLTPLYLVASFRPRTITDNLTRLFNPFVDRRSGCWQMFQHETRHGESGACRNILSALSSFIIHYSARITHTTATKDRRRHLHPTSNSRRE